MIDELDFPYTSTRKETDNKAVVKPEQESEMSFSDVLDIFNPLHHIPFVSKIYQKISGDEISQQSQSIGGIFFGMLSGGLLGAFGGVANAVLKQQSDKSLDEHVIALWDSDEEKSPNHNDIQDKKVKQYQQNQQTQNHQLSFFDDYS